ncbi:hypothetical protein HYFRA_00003348 [Hymenoscyphus fraxineus]|uniref:Uncharacterized protein n=1 Tax=Hymenoscyphus fraxineus TaxID=746836 RepID=A0A9N9PHJ7_9HELO|nr:hypothetical protein HYFRA_00003348 [Hymenoscyphus fraxineus]
MAPKRDGSDFDDGPGCTVCLAQVNLRGYDWLNGKQNAAFALYIIAVVVLIACLVLATRFKWVRKAGTDKLRHVGYKLATSFALIYFLLSIIVTALFETRAAVVHLFYIVYILESCFWRISEIMILSIIFRTLYESSSSRMVRGLPAINGVATTILALVSLTGFGLYTGYIATGAIASYSYGYGDEDPIPRLYGASVDFGYHILYLIATVTIGVYSVLILIKERSKANLLMSTVVAPALVIRSLLYAVSLGVNTFLNIGTLEQLDSILALSWASTFIYVLTAYPIFLGVALIGCIEPRNPNFLPEPKPTPSQSDHNVLLEYAHNEASKSHHGTTPVFYTSQAPIISPNGQTGFNGVPATAHTQPHIV